MLSGFDWLRRSKSGAELLATMRCIASTPHIFPDEENMGPPLSGSHKPCWRCWIYPCRTSPINDYCITCHTILNRARYLGDVSRSAIVIWGFVNDLPRQLKTREGFRDNRIYSSYVHDHNHFLVMIPKRELRPWLREIFIYHGSDMRGLIQIFSTVGAGSRGNMSDILCRAIHHETRFPMDRLRVRFYPDPYQLFTPRVRDEKGLLTFDGPEFLVLLEMAAVFRSIFRPDEQDLLYKVTNLNDKREKEFYWGRLMGILNHEAKDMLSAWKVKQWPKNKISLLFELTDYVTYTT